VTELAAGAGTGDGSITTFVLAKDAGGGDATGFGFVTTDLGNISTGIAVTAGGRGAAATAVVGASAAAVAGGEAVAPSRRPRAVRNPIRPAATAASATPMKS
jgi:hypothetical protein